MIKVKVKQQGTCGASACVTSAESFSRQFRNPTCGHCQVVRVVRCLAVDECTHFGARADGSHQHAHPVHTFTESHPVIPFSKRLWLQRPPMQLPQFRFNICLDSEACGRHSSHASQNMMRTCCANSSPGGLSAQSILAHNNHMHSRTLTHFRQQRTMRRCFVCVSWCARWYWQAVGR